MVQTGLSLEMIYDARRMLRDVTRLTPLISAPRIGKNVSIKAENLQLTGSFKLRGAYYKISRLSAEEKGRGIIACSAGNHAQGVALSAARMGVKSTICMPAGAPLSKIEATEAFGGRVVLVPGVFDDAYAHAAELAEREGYTFVHPFNDNAIIAGQGTIGLEILEQMPGVDAVVAPIGGGGLISGVAYAIKAIRPACKVYGVQAQGAPSMVHSVKCGRATALDSVATIADGIAVKKPGKLTFDYCARYIDGIVTVSESEISSAILTLMEANKTVAEGAGAASVSAVMFNKLALEGKKVVCIVSGGNIDVNILSRVITKGLVKTGRITEFSTQIPDKPGQLMNLLDIIGKSGANIMSIDHNREDKKAGVDTVVVHSVLETRNTAHGEEIFQSLADAGYELL